MRRNARAASVRRVDSRGPSLERCHEHGRGLRLPSRRWQIASAAVVVLLAAGAAMLFQNRKAQALTEKDTVLLADFVNTTGDPVFDGTLKQALAVQLEQSPFLNLLSDERVRKTLGFMGRPADERVTPTLAREICQREGGEGRAQRVDREPRQPLRGRAQRRQLPHRRFAGAGADRGRAQGRGSGRVGQGRDEPARKARRIAGVGPEIRRAGGGGHHLFARSPARLQPGRGGARSRRRGPVDPPLRAGRRPRPELRHGVRTAGTRLQQSRRERPLHRLSSRRHSSGGTASASARGSTSSSTTTSPCPATWTRTSAPSRPGSRRIRATRRSYTNLAVIYNLSLPKFERSIELTNDALRIDPDRSGPGFTSATAHMGLNRFDEAKAVADKAIANKLDGHVPSHACSSTSPSARAMRTACRQAARVGQGSARELSDAGVQRPARPLRRAASRRARGVARERRSRPARQPQGGVAAERLAYQAVIEGAFGNVEGSPRGRRSRRRGLSQPERRSHSGPGVRSRRRRGARQGAGRRDSKALPGRYAAEGGLAPGRERRDRDGTRISGDRHRASRVGAALRARPIDRLRASLRARPGAPAGEVRSRPLRPSSRGSSTIAAAAPSPPSTPSRTWAWRARQGSQEMRPRAGARTRTSWPSGRTPIPTCRSSRKPRRSTPGSSSGAGARPSPDLVLE